jgi:uncharacterized protein (DUF2235 family)
MRFQAALGPAGSAGLAVAFLLLLLTSTAAAQTGPAPPAGGARRLIVFLNGTLNSPEEGKHQKDAEHSYPYYEPTNVLKAFRAVSPVAAADGTSQISFYSDGVGSFIGNPATPGRLLKLADRFYGGVAGTGYEERVKAAYRFLVGNYRPGDQILIFGFSRGAAEARTLAVFMAWVGGPLHQEGFGGLLHKRDEYYIPELFLEWQRQLGKPGTAEAWFKKMTRNHPEAVLPPLPAEITFLGVFDTVISLGFRVAADFSERCVPTVGPKFGFYVDPTPPACVKTARQALAIDERRWDFRPQVWLGPAPGKPAASLEQRWFPGVHSNVGGGYRDDALAHTSLVWLLNEAHLAAGLDADCAYLRFLLKDRQRKRYQTDSGAYRIWEWLRGKSGRGVRELDGGAVASGCVRASAGANVHVDASAGARLHDYRTYRPPNLLRYLAADVEARIGDFATIDQPCVRELVEGFKNQALERQPAPACGSLPEPELPEPDLPEPELPAFCKGG